MRAKDITKTIENIISESLLNSDSEVYYAQLKSYNALRWVFFSKEATTKGLAIIQKLCQTGDAVGKKAYIPGPININEVQLDLVGSQWDSDRAKRVIKEVNDELKRQGFTKIISQ